MGYAHMGPTLLNLCVSVWNVSHNAQAVRVWKIVSPAQMDIFFTNNFPNALVFAPKDISLTNIERNVNDVSFHVSNASLIDNASPASMAF